MSASHADQFLRRAAGLFAFAGLPLPLTFLASGRRLVLLVAVVMPLGVAAAVPVRLAFALALVVLGRGGDLA
jgi:hypothetical protein